MKGEAGKGGIGDYNSPACMALILRSARKNSNIFRECGQRNAVLLNLQGCMSTCELNPALHSISLDLIILHARKAREIMKKLTLQAIKLGRVLRLL